MTVRPSRDEVRIADRRVGAGNPCFVIAEAGVNHDGDEAKAMLLIDAAADAGADAVKFQTFVADQVVSASAAKAAYQLDERAPNETQLDMLRRLELAPDAMRRLQERCRARGIVFLSSPFDDESLDVLDRLDVAAIKLGSGELTNLPFIARAARTGRPLIISTGMATLEEVITAVRAAGDAPGGLVLLHCVSEYPSPAAHSNLRAMDTLRHALGTPVGFSDHTLGFAVALAAVAMGARVIEKHITLDRTAAGPDHAASLEPDELVAFIEAIRAVELALGTGEKVPVRGEVEIAAVARKSVVVTRDVGAGEVLRAEDLAIRRPGTGLPPAAMAEVVGRTTRHALRAGDVLLDGDLA